MSVLGLDSGHTVKYTPPPEGIPEGQARGNSSHPNTDTVWLPWPSWKSVSMQEEYPEPDKMCTV